MPITVENGKDIASYVFLNILIDLYKTCLSNRLTFIVFGVFRRVSNFSLKGNLEAVL